MLCHMPNPQRNLADPGPCPCRSVRYAPPGEDSLRGALSGTPSPPASARYRTSGSGTAPDSIRPDRRVDQIGGSGAQCSEAWSWSVMASALAAGARPKRQGLCSVARWRCGALLPVNGFCVGGYAVGRAGEERGVRLPAAGETELAGVPGGAVMVVGRLVYGVGVDRAGAVAVGRSRGVAGQRGRLGVVAGARTFSCGVPFGLGAMIGRYRIRARPAAGTGRWPVPTQVCGSAWGCLSSAVRVFISASRIGR
jgi:hypothetical protein